MAERNRAEGWQYAKLSGHNNEEKVKNLLDTDEEFTRVLISRLNQNGKTVKEISVGGIHEKNVESIIPGARKTKSKTDLKIIYTDYTYNNISIKKSLGGQVYFVRSGLFFECYERQFNKTIPENVKRSISLFWAAADDASDIIRKYADKTNKSDYELQIRHSSLNADTLKRYDESLYLAMLSWFKNNAYELAILAFSSGAAKEKKEWADHVWYINLLEENEVDEVFDIEDICLASKQNAEKETFFGTTNGGTTIQLPFGFVEWHQHQMQFHHNYYKIKNLLGK